MWMPPVHRASYVCTPSTYLLHTCNVYVLAQDTPQMTITPLGGWRGLQPDIHPQSYHPHLHPVAGSQCWMSADDETCPMRK